MNANFREVAADLHDIEIVTVCIGQDGEFYIRNEKDGRIARVISQRARLRDFLLEFCQRLECPSAEHAEPKAAKKSKAA